MHAVIVSSDSFLREPLLTAEQVISEIDFMLQDMTPDSGYGENLSSSCIQSNLTTQSLEKLHVFIEELNRSIQDFSNILVQELAHRDELEYEKETKNTFISLLFDIQVRQQLIVSFDQVCFVCLFRINVLRSSDLIIPSSAER